MTEDGFDIESVNNSSTFNIDYVVNIYYCYTCASSDGNTLTGCMMFP